SAADDDGDGLSIDDGDCADFDAAFHPGAIDPIGDGIDQDCDDVDGTDADADGWPAGPDCDDADPDVAPDAAEVCDGVDQDCDGSPDNGVTCSAIVDVGGARRWDDGSAATSCDGYRHPPVGYAYAGLTGDGTYQVDPHGDGGFAAWCDMTSDGGGWTLAARIVGGSANHRDAAAVGALTSPTQGAVAKLADVTINALRGPSYLDSRVRFSCGAHTVYFADDAPFSAVSSNSGALDRCATTWDAATWTQAVPYGVHYGLNSWQAAPCPYMIYWLDESTRSGCYDTAIGSSQSGTVWVK
ncbi:MAG TPA: MopE-related protein, partial [Myxococcota bacterium]|nr:MopE-related protein [Myxococcota bacterium]